MKLIKLSGLILIVILGILFIQCEKNIDSDISEDDNLNDSLPVKDLSCLDSLTFSKIDISSLSKNWIMIYYLNDSDCIRNFEPEKDGYPITLNLTISDSMFGRHDANWYYGNFKIDSNIFRSVGFEVTDVGDLEYYWNFIDFLGDNYVLIQNDTLFLFSSDTNQMYCLITESLWNINHKDIDSIYNW